MIMVNKCKYTGQSIVYALFRIVELWFLLQMGVSICNVKSVLKVFAGSVSVWNKMGNGNVESFQLIVERWPKLKL
jgi:hypothetical protein